MTDLVLDPERIHMINSPPTQFADFLKRAAPATMTTSGLEVLEKSRRGEDGGTYLETRKVFR